MTELRHRHSNVWPPVIVSAVLAVGILWVLSSRAEEWNRRGDQAFAECSRDATGVGVSACFEAVSAYYKKAIRDFPFKGRYFASLGRSYERAGNPQKAAREYRKARWLGAEA